MSSLKAKIAQEHKKRLIEQMECGLHEEYLVGCMKLYKEMHTEPPKSSHSEKIIAETSNQ